MLTPPPDIGCHQFAALGPQLQALAEKADSDMALMDTLSILTLLDRPVMILQKTTPTAIAAGFAPLDVVYNTVEYTNGGGFTFSPSLTSANLLLPNRSPRQWFYVGAYMKTAAIDNGNWLMRLNVGDRDPITGSVTNYEFDRQYEAQASYAATGEDVWVETYIQSGGGGVRILAAHGEVGSVNVTGGRMWAVALSDER